MTLGRAIYIAAGFVIMIEAGANAFWERNAYRSLVSLVGMVWILIAILKMFG